MAAGEIKVVKIGSREFLRVGVYLIPVDKICEINTHVRPDDFDGRLDILVRQDGDKADTTYSFYGPTGQSLKEFIDTL